MATISSAIKAVRKYTDEKIVKTFPDLDLEYPQDKLALESKTDVAREHNSVLELPVTTGIKDVFVKFSPPDTVTSAGAFLLINNSYSYPIGIGSVSGEECSITYHGIDTSGDKLAYNQTYYVRVYNDGEKTTIELFDMLGDKISTYSVVEAIDITNLRFVTGTSVSCYDVVVFDGLLNDGMIREYFFGIEREILVTDIEHDGRKFKLGTKAENVLLNNGINLEENIMTIRKLMGKNLVCFGDSITGNYNPPVDYPTFVANLTGMNVINVGVGGTRMAYDGTYTNYDPFCMVKLVDAFVSGDWTEQDAAYPNLTLQGKRQVDNLKIVDLTTTDYVTIFHGTNDFTGTRGLENPDDDMDITYYEGATRYVLDKLLTHFPHLKILLITPLYRDRLSQGDGQNSDIPYRGNTMANYANKLVDISKQFHIPVLNLHDTSGINRYTANLYLEDGLHPSLEGRKLLGSKIAGGLLSVF